MTSSWKAHEQSKAKDAERDFKKLNKIAIKQGVVDAKVQYNLSLYVIYRNKKRSEMQMM